MSKADLLEKNPMTIMEVKKELEAAQKRDGELSFRGNKTLEYVNLFSKLAITKHNDLKKQLDDLNIPRLKPDHIVKIIDFLPKSVAELDVLLQGYTLTITKENKTKIISAVKEFL
ncbi:hypothetical protein K9L67_05955 [Candidatus Woesearchaeota archaeon]|nr:hypothetical protein [Candidatus Woesearchaeota archaeon]MCF7901738.1 hypothetical protein [Candidatus Woesearchaeota archaeon]MCF8013637.1 hypothetical protein [Candidatus Woesearchaeota archaeon]